MSGFIAMDGSSMIDLRSLGSIAQAKAYFATTGQETLANATVDSPASLFNPSTSGKNILITSWTVSSGIGSIVGFMYFITANTDYGTDLLISNAKAGGAASVLASSHRATFTATSTGAPGTGTQFRRLYQQYFVQLVPDGFGILLPNGSDSGVTTFMQSYAPGGIGSQSISYLEF